jgi:hypothetical protein
MPLAKRPAADFAGRLSIAVRRAARIPSRYFLFAKQFFSHGRNSDPGTTETFFRPSFMVNHAMLPRTRPVVIAVIPALDAAITLTKATGSSDKAEAISALSRFTSFGEFMSTITETS